MITAMLLRRYLERWGYEVLGPVSEGDLAISIALEKKPDLILMDILLKGEKDGIKASIEIRKKSDVPIIFLTSHGDKQTKKMTLDTHPAGYLTKPVIDAQLNSTISALLGQGD